MTDTNYKDSLVKFIPRNVLEFTVVTVILIIITYIFYSNLSLNENLELIGVYTFAMLKISLSANKLLLAFQNLKSVKIPIEISEELIQYSKIDKNLIDLNESIENKLKFENNIKLKNVHFTYSGTSKF